MIPPTNKKRQATTTRDQHKKSKLVDHSANDTNTKSGGLFDDLDEEMDPDVLDSVMQQLNGSDQSDNDTESNDELADDDSITSSYIPELDPVSDLLQEDQSETEEEQQKEEMETMESEDDTEQVAEQISKPLAGKFRDHYMGQMTTAFGSDLDTIRQEPGFTPARLNVLIDSLEAGMSVFSDLEKTIALDN